MDADECPRLRKCFGGWSLRLFGVATAMGPRPPDFLGASRQLEEFQCVPPDMDWILKSAKWNPFGQMDAAPRQRYRIPELWMS